MCRYQRTSTHWSLKATSSTGNTILVTFEGLALSSWISSFGTGKLHLDYMFQLCPNQPLAVLSVWITSKSLSAPVNKRTVWNLAKHQLFVLLEQKVARSASAFLNNSWAWADEIPCGEPGSGYLIWWLKQLRSGIQKLLYQATSVRQHTETWLSKTDLAKEGKKNTARCRKTGSPYHSLNIIQSYKSLGWKGHLNVI